MKNLLRKGYCTKASHCSKRWPRTRIGADAGKGKAAVVRGHTKMIGTILAIGIVGILLSGEASLAQNIVNVGNCTPGDQKCAADTVLICECYDEWRETDDGESDDHGVRVGGHR